MLSEIKKENQEELKSYLLSRTAEISSEVLLTVAKILQDVRERGDSACQAYTEQFDCIKMDSWRVSEEELAAAASQCDPAFMEAMKNAKKNIMFFHQAQVQQSYLLQKEMGIYLGQRILPLDGVGIYVPGGRAQYPSSVLMNAVPAHVAGVKRIVMTTPPDIQGQIHPNIAFAAKLAGVTEIYKMGGAQAIGALAYGTETIPSVDKIVGPGNIFVAAAKKLVYGTVDIDMIAGPSEILVIADAHANPAYIAADLLSQAEHDPMASSILLTVERSVLDAVNEELKKQVRTLPKRDIAEESLKQYGKAILCDSIEECIDFSNAMAPEHLELMIEDPMSVLGQVLHAGSVFMGYDTCESIGDYYGGTNHVLPTSGTARFSSALGVDSFTKRSCFLHYTREALDTYGSQIITMAQQEDLEAHARAVKVRMSDE